MQIESIHREHIDSPFGHLVLPFYLLSLRHQDCRRQRASQSESGKGYTRCRYRQHSKTPLFIALSGQSGLKAERVIKGHSVQGIFPDSEQSGYLNTAHAGLYALCCLLLVCSIPLTCALSFIHFTKLFMHIIEKTERELCRGCIRPVHDVRVVVAFHEARC